MKKLFLLLAASSMAMSAGAQERSASVVFNRSTNTQKQDLRPASHPIMAREHSGARTTAVTSNWYDYGTEILATNASLAGTGFSTMFFWPDTSAIFGTGSTTTPYLGYNFPGAGYSYNVSVGLGFNPLGNDWAIATKQVLMADDYMIDSVQIVGIYGRPDGPTYTDHLHLSFVYGDLTSATNIGKNGFIDPTLLANYGLTPSDTAWFPEVFYDSPTNSMTKRLTGSGPAAAGFDFPLNVADTSVTFTHGYTFPVSFHVPAGNMAAMSVSFVPGSSFVAGDTVQYTDGTFKYGDFQPIVNFATDGAAGNVVFAPYTGGNHLTDDQTYGYLKTLGSTDGGWVGDYVPHISYSASTGGGWYEQFPFILYHIIGTTKVQSINAGLTGVTASPNPASNEVSINFSLASASKVTVSLTNAMGQVVATTVLDNMSHGKATFNTSDLASGVYFYTVSANGERSTGRVAIAH